MHASRYKNLKYNFLYLIPLALLLLVMASFPQESSAAELCPAGSTYAKIGYLHTCIDTNKQVLRNADKSLKYTFTDAQVQEWAKANGKTLQQVIEEGRAAGGEVGALDTCSGITAFFLNPFNCIGRSLSVVIGTALITVTAWLLSAASYLFNVLVDHTIVRFGTILLDTGVRQAIETGWTALRDIANIVIIAMFVFIAINIILGSKEYGEKRLIARVLIIAVLINFSLLFSKAIIDASNFTALQFYKASAIETDVTAAQTAKEAIEYKYAEKGIAGQFIKFMGLTSIGETTKAMSAAAFGTAEKRYTNANGMYALLHAIVSATLLLFAAAVLLYGCYLLISRAVLLIFLMITSALAFASWLIPQQRVVKGFAKWWESLLKAALLAPLLMIFLWSALNVARAVATTTKGKGSLGALVTNPNETLNLEALFSYVIVLGLLFASIYAANLFSKNIAGFAAAGKFGVGLPLSYAATYGATMGLVGRNTFGKYGLRVTEATRKRVEEKQKENPNYRPNMVERGLMNSGAFLGRRTFDPTAMKPVTQAIRSMGGMVVDTGWGKGGYEGVKSRQAEEGLRRAREAGFKSETEIRADAAREQQSQRDRLRDERDFHHKQLQTSNLEAVHQQAHDEKKAALDRARTEAGQETVEQKHTRASGAKAANEAAQAQARKRIEDAKLIADDTHRQRVTRESEDELRALEAAVPDLDRSLGEAAREAEAFKQELNRAGDEAVAQHKQYSQAHIENVDRTLSDLDTIVEKRVATVSQEAVGRQSAHWRPSTLFGLIGTPEEDPAGKRIKGAARKHAQKEAVDRILEGVKDYGNGRAARLGGSPSAPGPGTPGGTTPGTPGGTT